MDAEGREIILLSLIIIIIFYFSFIMSGCAGDPNHFSDDETIAKFKHDKFESSQKQTDCRIKTEDLYVEFNKKQPSPKEIYRIRKMCEEKYPMPSKPGACE